MIPCGESCKTVPCIFLSSDLVIYGQGLNRPQWAWVCVSRRFSTVHDRTMCMKARGKWCFLRKPVRKHKRTLLHTIKSACLFLMAIECGGVHVCFCGYLAWQVLKMTAPKGKTWSESSKGPWMSWCPLSCPHCGQHTLFSHYLSKQTSHPRGLAAHDFSQVLSERCNFKSGVQQFQSASGSSNSGPFRSLTWLYCGSELKRSTSECVGSTPEGVVIQREWLPSATQIALSNFSVILQIRRLRCCQS